MERCRCRFAIIDFNRSVNTYFAFGLQPPNFLEVQSKVRQPKVISGGNRSIQIELSSLA